MKKVIREGVNVEKYGPFLSCIFWVLSLSEILLFGESKFFLLRVGFLSDY